MTAPLRATGGSTSQAAARLLVLLDRLGQPPTPVELAWCPEAINVVRSTSRLAKLDFWLRNPDYLADELLRDVAAGTLEADVGLAQVDRMLSGDAPTLHVLPMQRYRFGAWELPDNAMAVLKSHRLVRTRRVSEPDADNAERARRDYLLTADGGAVVTRMRAEVPQLTWYDAQAEAIGLLHVGTSGAAVKQRQYEQPEYASTPIGSLIGPILDRTRRRFSEVAKQHDYAPMHTSTARNGNVQ